MRVNIIIITALLLFGCSRPFMKRIPREKLTTTLNDTIFQKLQLKYDLLILSQANAQSERLNGIYYYGIGLKNRNWFKIVYYMPGWVAVPPVAYSPNEMLITNTKKCDSVLNTFIVSKFWRIRENDEGCQDAVDTCYLKATTRQEKMNIGNSCGLPSHYSYRQLIIITKKGYFQKTYVNPEIWEKCICCTPSKDRQIFIKCYNALMATK